MEDPKLKLLIAVLVEWINDELAEHRIIVQNVDEDLYDGQVLQKLLGKIYLLLRTSSSLHILLSYFSDRKVDRAEVGCARSHTI
jgi:hypothetical protein